MKPIRQTCTLRHDVLKGDLADAIFAADFGHVIEERAPAVYQQATLFFQNTHPAAPLRTVLATIFERLSSPDEAGAALRLSTGFGGGKSHTLIALWHLARNSSDPALGTELLPAAGRPSHVVVAGIDGEKGLTKHSLWGELAYKLGGEVGYAHIAPYDSPTTPPNAALVQRMLPDMPVLILLDELVIYMASLNQQGQGALLGFLGLLMSEIGARTQAVLVITDPAGQTAYREEAAALGRTIDEIATNEAAQRLDDVLGRKATDFDPIGNEAAQVIVRRLFEHVDRQAADAASAEYHHAYKRIAEEHPDLLPPDAATLDYAQQLLACYPFHPRMLETAQDRLGALQAFNKSRGTLRLFARILRTIWEQQSPTTLITAGDLDWASERIQADLLRRLQRDEFKSAVDADIIRHAGRLDADFATDMHGRVASALLLESLPLTPQSALDRRDLALAVLRPSEVGPEPGEALDRLLHVAWHLYKDETGRRFQFRYEPNANKLIEERADTISPDDARDRVLAMVQSYFGGRIFLLVPYPGSPRAVSDTARLKLVLSDSEPQAQAICDYLDDSKPDAKERRPFRNAVLGIAPVAATLSEAVREMRRQMAAEAIADEQQKGTPLKQQIDEILPTLQKRARIQAYRAFNRIILQGRAPATLDEKYLVSENSPLSNVSGQNSLKQYLDDYQLIYQTEDVLDVDLLLDEVVQGSVPSLDHEGAYPASAVHERALGNPRLKLFLDEAPIRSAMIKAVEQGKLVVRHPNGDVYDHQGCVSGSPGNRTRSENQKLRGLRLESDVLVAPVSASCVAEWLKTDDPEPLPPDAPIPVEQAAAIKFVTEETVQQAIAEGTIDYEVHDGQQVIVYNEKFQNWQSLLPEPDQITTGDWEEAIAAARKRPLQALKLTARKPDVARKLIGLAQPFGATTLTISVNVGGALKDGGTVRFKADKLKHNHALKPLDMAASMYRAMGQQVNYEAVLELSFAGEGVTGLSTAFERACEDAGSEVLLNAEFGKEV